MTALQEQYVTDREGNRIGVIVGLKQYQDLLDRLEELEDIKAFDEAMAEGGDTIPFDRAMAEIDAERR